VGRRGGGGPLGVPAELKDERSLHVCLEAVTVLTLRARRRDGSDNERENETQETHGPSEPPVDAEVHAAVEVLARCRCREFLVAVVQQVLSDQ